MDGERASRYLKEDAKNELVLSAATEITGRYYESAAELVSVVSAPDALMSSKIFNQDWFVFVYLLTPPYLAG